MDKENTAKNKAFFVLLFRAYCPLHSLRYSVSLEAYGTNSSITESMIFIMCKMYEFLFTYIYIERERVGMNEPWSGI